MSPKDRETIVIKQKDAPDITVELAEYLDILGSPIRLTMLKLLESEPMDVQAITHRLHRDYHKTSTRENTKNHIDKLLSIGLVVKRPGIRDNRAVIEYRVVPGSIETAMRTLSRVMKLNFEFDLGNKAAEVHERLSGEFSRFPIVRILGGVDDGKEFFLKKTEVKIGRWDPNSREKYDPENDIVLSDEYRAVTRVWKPHARLILEDEEWFIENCEAVNETYIWNRKLQKYKREKLKDGDMIRLAPPKGACLVFLLPESADKKSVTADS